MPRTSPVVLTPKSGPAVANPSREDPWRVSPYARLKPGILAAVLHLADHLTPLSDSLMFEYRS
jgi:hypothetical protein